MCTTEEEKEHRDYIFADHTQRVEYSDDGQFRSLIENVIAPLEAVLPHEMPSPSTTPHPVKICLLKAFTTKEFGRVALGNQRFAVVSVFRGVLKGHIREFRDGKYATQKGKLSVTITMGNVGT